MGERDARMPKWNVRMPRKGRWDAERMRERPLVYQNTFAAYIPSYSLIPIA